MSETKFTPGPLTVNRRSDDNDRQFEVVSDWENPDHHNVKWEDRYVSFSGYFGSHGPHVFAAAPDLYAALEMAQIWLDIDGRFDMQGINTALAKARGEA